MSRSLKPATPAPTFTKGVAAPSSSTTQKNDDSRRVLLVAAATMSWQLALVVLIPVISGAMLDKKLGTAPAGTLVGLAVALVGSVVVIRQAVQAANRIPVPKLTAAQKRAIQKSYEEDDE